MLTGRRLATSYCDAASASAADEQRWGSVLLHHVKPLLQLSAHRRPRLAIFGRRNPSTVAETKDASGYAVSST